MSVSYRVPVWYVAHPVGNGRLVTATVAENIARAKRWLRWLIDHEPHAAFCVPWLPYLDVLDEANRAHRDRGIRDDVSAARLCDGIVLCGGEITPGMMRELEVCDVVCDLTCLGAEPPSAEDWGDGDPDLIGPIVFGRERWAQAVRDQIASIVDGASR